MGFTFVYGIKINGPGLAVALALILALIALSSAAAEEPGLVIVTSKLDLTGNWRLTLTDENNVTRYVNLTLHQVEREVFGRGNMTTENVTQAVVVGGFFGEDILNLYLIAVEGDLMFKLSFEVHDNEFMLGNYGFYSSDGTEMNGSGSASRYIKGPIEAFFGPKPPNSTKPSGSSVSKGTSSEDSNYETSDTS